MTFTNTFFMFIFCYIHIIFYVIFEYYDDFDYIVGDWAYGKLRLKGFYDSKNSKVKDFNNYEKVESYIKNNCAYGCKYFILQKQ